MRQIVTLLATLFTSVGLLLAGDNAIVVVQPFTGTLLSAPSTNYSAALDLNAYKPVAFTYALQLLATNLTVTNAGDVTVSYELSNNNSDYLSNSNIVSGLSFTNSPTTGGKGFYQFDAGKSRYIRFKAIVTGTNSLWLSGWLSIQ